jgi:plasmid maintenance system antidote protein VapI
VLGKNGIWYTLSACLWKSPFMPAKFQDLSRIYPSLEELFVKQLQVKSASLSMLIDEVRRMTEEAAPRIDKIRTLLIEIGKILSSITIDDGIARALTDLKQAKFLPRKVSGGTAVLVKTTDDYAIPDHQRYANAFADHSLLLNFQRHEVLSLHVFFRSMGLTRRYISSLVQEGSTVGASCVKNESLSKQLQAKAYALYW